MAATNAKSLCCNPLFTVSSLHSLEVKRPPNLQHRLTLGRQVDLAYWEKSRWQGYAIIQVKSVQETSACTGVRNLPCVWWKCRATAPLTTVDLCQLSLSFRLAYSSRWQAGRGKHASPLAHLLVKWWNWTSPQTNFLQKRRSSVIPGFKKLSDISPKASGMSIYVVLATVCINYPTFIVCCRGVFGSNHHSGQL